MKFFYDDVMQVLSLAPPFLSFLSFFSPRPNEPFFLSFRGGFEVGLRWKDGRISEATLLARNGRTCRVRPAAPVKVAVRGRAVSVRRPEPGLIEFKTEPSATYALTPAGR
jgi:hypothetical protein